MQRIQFFGMRLYLAVAIAVLAAGTLAFNSLSEPSLEKMKAADSVEECMVVKSSCHGKRYSINKDYEQEFYQKMGFTDQICTHVLTPMDALNYSSRLSNGQCQLEVNISNECRESETPMCADQREIIDEVYS